MQQALRGRLWRLFMRLDQKKDAGVYDQLVQKALGKTKYGRRVRDRHTRRLRRPLAAVLRGLPA